MQGVTGNGTPFYIKSEVTSASDLIPLYFNTCKAFSQNLFSDNVVRNQIGENPVLYQMLTHPPSFSGEGCCFIFDLSVYKVLLMLS